MTLLGRDVVVVVVAAFSSSSHRRPILIVTVIILIFIADVVVVVVVVIGAASPSAHDSSAKPLPAILRTAIQGTHFFLLFSFVSLQIFSLLPPDHLESRTRGRLRKLVRADRNRDGEGDVASPRSDARDVSF